MLKWLVTALVIWVVWKLFFAKPRPSPSRPVSTPARERREAMRVLGVGPAADGPAIRDAHRRRIAEAHPDRGGSTELTRELNAARDLLLNDPR